MNDPRIPAAKKWPFYVADVILLSFAFWLMNHYPHPLSVWVATLMTGCVVAAAVVATLPYRMEYQTAARLAEGDNLTDAAAQIKNFEAVAEKIRLATSQWQGVQEHSTKTVAAAKEIGDRLTAEAHHFADFMQKANDSEKATLRLEVEKLRRGEGEWLQVLVHLLDHVFALHQAGARSGQANLATQLGQFQQACREIVRRVGLLPFEAAPNEPFDDARHQVVEGEPAASPEAVVSQTLATGYTYQGQLLRRSLVEVRQNGETGSEAETETSTALYDADPNPEAGSESEPGVDLQAESNIFQSDPSTPTDPRGLSGQALLEASEDSPEVFRLDADVLPAEGDHSKKA